MAVYQVEEGTYQTRNFSGDGIGKKIYDWVQKTPAAGGPGWYVIDESMSGLASYPFIVISNSANPQPNDGSKIIQITINTSVSNSIWFHYYLWWDTTVPTGYGLWAGYENLIDATAQEGYTFLGGDQCMMFNFNDGANRYICLLDEWQAISGAVEHTSVQGTIQSDASGYGPVLQLGAGEASKFTQYNHYFVCNFSGVSNVDFVRCTDVNAGSDQITVDSLKTTFPSGSVIGAYPHRFFATSSRSANSRQICLYKGKVPYSSCKTLKNSIFYTDTIYYPAGAFRGAARTKADSEILGKSAPDDMGNYIATNVVIHGYRNESDGTAESWRLYGYLKNILFCDYPEQTDYSDQIVIDSKTWKTLGYHAGTIFDSASASHTPVFNFTTSTS